MEKNDIIRKYAGMLATLEYSVGTTPQIFLKWEDRCFAVEKGADLGNLADTDIVDMTDRESVEKDVLMGSRSMNALVLAKPPYIGICIDAGREIHAAVDDMAQIVGRRVRFAGRSVKEIRRALKHADAVMVQEGEGYVITSGRNLYEAYVALTVLEKSAEIVLKASVLGGAKPLGAADCKLMREVYKRKYSKAEKEHKNDAEG